MTQAKKYRIKPVVDEIKAMIDAQQEKGLQKYGVPVQIDSYILKGWIEHAQQECIDFLIYLECIKRSIDIRPEVLWFARQMEKKLRENDHKPHWRDIPPEYHTERLLQEYLELLDAIIRENPDEIISEAADVANFAMFSADNARGERHGQEKTTRRNAPGEESQDSQRVQTRNEHSAYESVQSRCQTLHGSR